KLNSKNIDLKLAEIAGMDLLYMVSGYDNLIVIDSIKTGKLKIGEVVEIEENKQASFRILSSHDISFFEMLKMGKKLGLKMPDKIKIFGIEIKDNVTFSEKLTDELKDKLHGIIEKIEKQIKENLIF
ncbi:MAG: hydrogenase maturation protease, partial [Candidatus Goldbacteria bacterium]|nr:hydrogenase maturation protease [Candidatus Goldiibacteriota bacterium]